MTKPVDDKDWFYYTEQPYYNSGGNKHLPKLIKDFITQKTNELYKPKGVKRKSTKPKNHN